MLILSSKRTPNSVIKTRIDPATYAAHLTKDPFKTSKAWKIVNNVDKPNKKEWHTFVKDLGRNIFLPFHMTLADLHPWNLINPCQRLDHGYSILTHMIPDMVKMHRKRIDKQKYALMLVFTKAHQHTSRHYYLMVITKVKNFKYMIVSIVIAWHAHYIQFVEQVLVLGPSPVDEPGHVSRAFAYLDGFFEQQHGRLLL